jgi:hypothetical protein
MIAKTRQAQGREIGRKEEWLDDEKEGWMEDRKKGRNVGGEGVWT